MSQGPARQAEVGVRTRALLCAGVVGGARARAFSSPTPRGVGGFLEGRSVRAPGLGFLPPSPTLQRWRTGAEIIKILCPWCPPSSGGQSLELGGAPVGLGALEPAR